MAIQGCVKGYGIQISLALVLAVTSIAGANDCPEVSNKENTMIKIDNICYHYVEATDTQVSFDVAQPDCASRGGHLVTIKNNKTQAELVRVLQNEFQVSSHTVLIGLQKLGSTWKWVTGEGLSYTNWENSLTCQDCDCAKMKLTMDGAWEKVSCQQSDWFTAYVCQYDPSANGAGQNSGHPVTLLTVLSTCIAVAMTMVSH